MEAARARGRFTPEPIYRITEAELQAWAAITERHIALERAARAYLRKRTRARLLELRRAVGRRPRP